MAQVGEAFEDEPPERASDAADGWMRTVWKHELPSFRASGDELETSCIPVQVLAGDAAEAGTAAHAGVGSSTATD